MKHSKKQPTTKPAGKARKSPKSAPADAARKTEKAPRARARDPRLPAAGKTIVRPYKGREIRVKVLEDGFEYEGTHYRSLTGIAKVVSGYDAISGPFFFGLAGPARETPRTPNRREKRAAEEPRGAQEPAPSPESATA